jgi:hypothetical protein
MSDADTVAEIERHNVMCWESFREYWRKQGVKIKIADPTKPITATGFVAGLPRGYRGEDAIRVREPYFSAAGSALPLPEGEHDLERPRK